MPTISSNDGALPQAVTLLKTHQCPLLISHPRPDGDTVGSALALRLALLHLGKIPTLLCVHPLPSNLTYLPGADTYRTAVSPGLDFDLVIAVDLSDLNRSGGLYQEAWRTQFPLLVIDHHETNDHFGDVNLVYPEAAATALPMTTLIEALGVPLDGDIATCLLAGILTDTRGLRTANTSPDVLRLVGRLIEAGGDYSGVMEKSLDSIPYRQMRGWGVALERLQLEDGLAWTTFPLEEKRKLGIEDYDDLDLGNLLSRLAEAKIMVTFLAMRDGTVKVSLRSRAGYNVAHIAKALGGGGHQQAAGCSITGTLRMAQDQVLPLARAELNRACS